MSSGAARTAKRIVLGLFILALAIAAITLRVVVAGELEIAASTDALLTGDARAAAVHAKAAATWYAPGAPHVRVAYQRLMALGDAAMERQNRELALLAYRAVRTSSQSTRWLVTPHAGDAQRAGEAIARIESNAPRPPSTTLVPAQEIERGQLEALARKSGPRVEWIAALAVAFSAWVVGLAQVLLRAVDESGKVSWPRARFGIAVGTAGLALWAVALYFA